MAEAAEPGPCKNIWNATTKFDPLSVVVIADCQLPNSSLAVDPE